MLRIGVDLGGTNIAAGLVNDKNEIIKKTSVPTSDKSFEGVCRAIASLCESLSSGASVSEIGVGSPGIANASTGVVERWSNLNFVNAPLAERVSALCGLPVYIENDANAAALGEYVAGAGRGTEDFVLVTIGTGIGCGAVLGGKLYRGKNHSAFELGHTVIDLNGPVCTCGRRGCFETLASATALVRQAKEAAKACPESLLNQSEINGKTVFEALRLGDGAAKAVFDRYVKYLAAGVTDLINLLQPQVLCIGGGVSGAGEALLAPLRELVSREEYAKDCAVRTKIMPALLGNDAGIIGAAAIPLYL
ncbi:MAG: ROK family protein [Clostridia bacterium]|nr:ROK family protein [Clostridia bacterium]